jgi:phage tail sheath protein FI
MPELKHPGVYIQEVPSAPAPIQGVSTSTLALIGFTEEGPTDEPTFVTSMSEFKALFGDFTQAGLLPTTLYAFFKNGGQVAVIVRVVGAGAEAAKSYVYNQRTAISTAFTGDGSTTADTFTVSQVPIVPGSISIPYKYGVNVAAESLGTGNGATTSYSGTLAHAPLTDEALVFSWTSTTPRTRTIAANTTGTGSGDGTSATINRTSGAYTLNTTGAIPDNSTAITVQYKYQSATQYVTDDGEGALTGNGTGTVDYVTGDVSVTYSQPPYSAGLVSIDYKRALWEIQMKWAGDKGNDYRTSVEGAAGYEADDTATFTRWTFRVSKVNDAGEYEVKETFENLSFDTSTDADFFPTAVNDTNKGSAIVTVVDVGNTGVPTDLSGTLTSSETIGTGNGTNTTFTATLAGASVHPTTLVITASKTGPVTMTVTDDGNGNLIGDVAPTGNNTIDYDTGEIDVTFEAAVINLGSVVATYYTQGDQVFTDDMTGGADGSAVTNSQVTAAALEADNLGLYALNKTDELLLVSIPDFAGNEVVDGALVDYCDARKDRFAILTTPEGLSYQEAINYKKFSLQKNSSYYALYYPWVSVLDPVTEKAINIPPAGHVAGVYARTDSNKNVGKAPAGIEDGGLRFALGLEKSLTAAEVGLLNPQRVNAIVDWQQLGTIAVWGARTGQTGGEFGYIQARRLFMFLEKSIFNATHIYVFENNGSSLWARIRLQLTGFMLRLYGQGYFAGDTPEQAFFVLVDSSNNPPESIDAGILNVDVGVAPHKPAEFIVFRFQQILQTG